MVTLSSFVANAQAVNDEGAVLTTTSHCDFRPFAYLQVYPSGPCFFAVQYNTVSHTRVLSHKAQVGRLTSLGRLPLGLGSLNKIPCHTLFVIHLLLGRPRRARLLGQRRQ